MGEGGRRTSDGEASFDARRVFCLPWPSLDVIGADRDGVVNAPKPALAAVSDLLQIHRHLSDEVSFPKRGASPAPNGSIAQLVISRAKIATLIWQPDSDLQDRGSCSEGGGWFHLCAVH